MNTMGCCLTFKLEVHWRGTEMLNFADWGVIMLWFPWIHKVRCRLLHCNHSRVLMCTHAVHLPYQRLVSSFGLQPVPLWWKLFACMWLENAAWTVKGTSYVLLDFRFHLASRECGMIMLWTPARQKNWQSSCTQQVLSQCYSECW